MKLYLPSYIEKVLERAKYEYDESVNRWIGWIDEIPGVYAQDKSVELVRRELASALEDFILISLKEGKIDLPGFAFPRKRRRAKANQS